MSCIVLFAEPAHHVLFSQGGNHIDPFQPKLALVAIYALSSIVLNVSS